MSENELRVSGIGISKSVISTIVSLAASKVDGVASVGGNDIASSLISVFTCRTVSQDTAVESSVEDDKLRIGVHVAAFYGYPFVKLASDIRATVTKAVSEQVGVDVSAVDVCIDSLVFPKE